jgi:hypothetical protein
MAVTRPVRDQPGHVCEVCLDVESAELAGCDGEKRFAAASAWSSLPKKSHDFFAAAMDQHAHSPVRIPGMHNTDICKHPEWGAGEGPFPRCVA